MVPGIGGDGSKAKGGNDAKKTKKSSLLRPDPIKDPYIEAEEEELRYLERKLGLTGEWVEPLT